jgi:hypothetical protein
LITAATGVFVIPAVRYLGGLGLARDDLIQALGLSFTVSTVALAAASARGDSFQGTAAGASLLALVSAMLGMVLGGWVRGRFSEKAFRHCFFSSCSSSALTSPRGPYAKRVVFFDAMFGHRPQVAMSVDCIRRPCVGVDRDRDRARRHRSTLPLCHAGTSR